jgi:serine/threonine protein kinase/Tfp pilus assembly protein PilF
MPEVPDPELTIFSEARLLPPGQRGAYLDEACAGDAALRRRVEELLQAGEKAGAFLENPAAAASPGPGGTIRVTVLPVEKLGDRVGRYKILQQIGEGGCGVVYMAEQEEPVRRRVALKVIKLGMDTKSVIARFEAERQALAMMDHPNIAKVLDAGATDTGRPYFVMELVRGIKITDYCDQNNLPTEARLDLFLQVCRAVQHAHQKGIIHRDIKPSNILVTHNDGVPVPKVIDFGIAKATQGKLTDHTLFTAFEQFIGTPAYMSPEQAEMSALDIDTRSDLYSMGVLLYELLTGKTPFDAAELMEAGIDGMRRHIREKEPARPSTRLSTMLAADLTSVAAHRQAAAPKLIHMVRGDLDWIVMKCLEKDRTRRYETANGLASDIQRHLNNEPVLASPPSKLYQFRKLVKRHKLAFAAAMAVLAALALGLAVSSHLFLRERQAHQKTIVAEQEQDRLRERAETEAGKSRQVVNFLEEMLGGVGPSVAAGRDATMLKEILDKTAQRVSRELTNQPEVEAELKNEMGEIYRALGQPDKAEAMQRAALALAAKNAGGDDEHAGIVMNNLALALEDQGKWTEAEKIIRESLALREKTSGTNQMPVANALSTLGGILSMEGKNSEADLDLRKALVIYHQSIDASDRRNVATVKSLGSVLRNQSKLPEAETLYREALALLRPQVTNDDPNQSGLLMCLGMIMRDEGRFSDAEKMLDQSVAMQRRLFADGHPDLARGIYELSSVIMLQGRLPEAETKYREALTMYQKTAGAENPNGAQIMNDLAAVLRKERKLDDAEALYRQALALLRQKVPEEHPYIAFSLSGLAAVRQAQGKPAEAESLDRQVLALRRKAMGNQSLGVATSLNDLAVDLYIQGKAAEAEGTQREALAIQVKIYGAGHPYVLNSLYNLVRSISLQTNLTAAQLQDKFAETEPVARQCQTALTEKYPDDWISFSGRCLLGYCLVGQKKYAEAEPLLLSGLDGLKQREDKVPAGDKPRLIDAVSALAKLYEATSRPDPAAQWKTTLADLKKADQVK